MKTPEPGNPTETGDQAKARYSLYEIGYVKLRTGMGVLAVLFPIIFLISSWVLTRNKTLYAMINIAASEDGVMARG